MMYKVLLHAELVLLCFALLFACSKATLSFYFLCPSHVLWRSTAEKTCNYANHYHCLFDFNSKQFKEVCLSPEKQTAGSQVILDTNLNAEKCRSTTFQPQHYFSNEFNRCIYDKSVCNERGQTTFSDGTDKTDRTCRCDHQKGYAFVVKTENQCFCVPSKEDCSCYLKPCLNSSYILSSGFECVLSKTDRNICSFRESGKPTSKIPVAKPRLEVNYNSKKYNVSRKKVDPWFLLLLLVVTIAVITFIPGAYFIYTCGTAASKNSRWPDQIKAETLLEIRRFIDRDMFVPTEGYRKAAQVLNKFNYVVIKGRNGTGKTNTALRLASDIHDTHTPYIFHRPNLSTLQILLNRRGVGKNKNLVILENIIGDSLNSNPELKEWEGILLFLLQYKTAGTKIIITTYVVNHILRALLLQNIDRSISGIHFGRIIMDLDEQDTISHKEKTEILEKNCRLYGREFPSDYQDIVTCDSFIGYPMMCALYCSDNNNFALGPPFFHNPPITFIDKIKALKVNGFDSIVASIKYTVLVYIALADSNVVSLDDASLDITLFNTIFKTTFKKEYSHGKTLIVDCADSFIEQYLKIRNPMEYQICHTSIRRAVLITYGMVSLSHLIQKACLSELLTIIRPCSYKQRTNEAVVTISNTSGYLNFLNLLVNEFQQTKSNCKNIGVFLRKYAVTSHDFNFLESVLTSFREFTESVKGYKFIPFMIQVFYEMTDGCKHVLPCDLEPIHFHLKWEIIVAAYFSHEDTFDLLVEHVMTTTNRRNFMSYVIDDLGNTLLHYFVIWGYDAGLCLCEEHYRDKEAGSIKNFAGYTPLFFAAYLGRSKYLKILIQRTKKDDSVLAVLRQKWQETLSEDDIIQFTNLEDLISNGKAFAGKIVTSSTQTRINVDPQIVQTITYGTHSDYDESMEIVNRVYNAITKSMNRNEIEKANVAFDYKFEEDGPVHELYDDNVRVQTPIHVERCLIPEYVEENVTKHESFS